MPNKRYIRNRRECNFLCRNCTDKPFLGFSVHWGFPIFHECYNNVLVWLFGFVNCSLSCKMLKPKWVCLVCVSTSTFIGNVWKYKIVRAIFCLKRRYQPKPKFIFIVRFGFSIQRFENKPSVGTFFLEQEHSEHNEHFLCRLKNACFESVCRLYICFSFCAPFLFFLSVCGVVFGSV